MSVGQSVKRSPWFVLVLAVLLLARHAVAADVHADSVAPPSSYTVTSPGDEYVFVMLSPLPLESDVSVWIKEKQDQIRQIRSSYDQSGLYRNDGSTDPLWTVDWYAYWIEPSSDGVHLVRPGPWASSAQQEAVSFYANGELLRTYSIDQLVDFPSLLPRSVSHFEWQAEASLDDDNKVYRMRTLHGEIYRFDITTGETILSFRTPRWLLIALLAATAAVASGVSIRRTRRRKVAEAGTT